MKDEKTPEESTPDIEQEGNDSGDTQTLQKPALGTDAVDTIRVICILVEFTDWPASGQSIFATQADFDSLLFSDRDQDEVFNVTGSMTDYYLETSYGTVYIQGDVLAGT